MSQATRAPTLAMSPWVGAPARGDAAAVEATLARAVAVEEEVGLEAALPAREVGGREGRAEGLRVREQVGVVAGALRGERVEAGDGARWMV